MKQSESKQTERQERTIRLEIKRNDIIWASGLAVMFIACLELFYRMIVNYNDRYESDMHYYAITTVTNGDKHARFVEILSQQLYNINNNTMEFNIYMALVIPAIIVLNLLVINYYLKKDDYLESVPRYSRQIASFTALFTGPVFFPILHEYYYMKSFRCFAWHNPTHQTMLVFSLAASLCFLQMYLNYEKGVSLKWWVATMLTCLLSASAKPSFIINLSIAIVVFFIIELIRKGKDGFKTRFIRLFVMGCAAIPAGLYTVGLSTFEFGDSAVNGGEYHVIFGWEVLKTHDNWFKMFVFGIPFAIFICLINNKRFKDNKYLFALLMFVAGVAQWALLGETGARANHGNFGWGRMYGNYFITLIATVILLENIYVDETMFTRNKKMRMAYIVVALLILMISVLSQLNYFRLVLTGHGYML